MEEWRYVSGYEGLYEVSSLGRVRRGNKFIQPWRSSAPGNYYYFRLKRKTVSLARTVAAAFLPLIDGKTEVDHIDKDVTNNIVSNLRWVDGYEQALNREMPIPPSGHRCILITRSNTYEVRIRRKCQIVFNKNFKTLEEAIRARDDFLS